MAFQRFAQSAKSNYPKASILPNGLIEFNKGATRKFALNRFNFAVLYFDEEANQIGIQFINNAREKGAVRIIKKPTGAAVPARDFLMKHGLLKSRNTSYFLSYIGEFDMYIIQLKEEDEKKENLRVAGNEG
jgi:hypothetical protein